MNVNEIITKNYERIKKLSLRPDICVFKSQTSDDVLQNILLTTLKKFQDKDLEEEEVLKYIEKSFVNEIRFQYKRLKNEKVIFTDTLPDIPE